MKVYLKKDFIQSCSVWMLLIPLLLEGCFVRQVWTQLQCVCESAEASLQVVEGNHLGAGLSTPKQHRQHHKSNCLQSNFWTWLKVFFSEDRTWLGKYFYRNKDIFLNANKSFWFSCSNKYTYTHTSLQGVYSAMSMPVLKWGIFVCSPCMLRHIGSRNLLLNSVFAEISFQNTFSGYHFLSVLSICVQTNAPLLTSFKQQS